MTIHELILALSHYPDDYYVAPYEGERIGFSIMEAELTTVCSGSSTHSYHKQMDFIEIEEENL